MELKKNKIAKMFKVTLLTVDNWEKNGKIKRIKEADSLIYDLQSVLQMANQTILQLESKRNIVQDAINLLLFEIEQDKIYTENIEKYNKAMGK
jgi:hypothetical protein